ncbi:DNA-binding protein [Micromonospora zhanjiangensis]|uniref:DNA-binding protein n=1 Tax=Micromonospora zhanjiangensis TaxID=1522057 RepID=A0ABV8KFA1_9ACTN
MGRRYRLMGAHEIRMRLGGISRQRVYAITSHRSFPAPVAELQQGNVWDTDDVEDWIREHRPNLTDEE